MKSLSVIDKSLNNSFFIHDFYKTHIANAQYACCYNNDSDEQMKE